MVFTEYTGGNSLDLGAAQEKGVVCKGGAFIAGVGKVGHGGSDAV